ncbi:MAG: RNA pyrophosphohydrolase, partial [Gammaproteobacteria bacterium]|nr:RNA pyrophosphohydrolase [Gammaproteobacteria bacterium]
MSDVIDRDGFRANVGIVLMADTGKLFLGRRTG